MILKRFCLKAAAVADELTDFMNICHAIARFVNYEEIQGNFRLLGASQNNGQYKFNRSSYLKNNSLPSVLLVPHQWLAP